MISTMQILVNNFDLYLSLAAIVTMIIGIVYGFMKGNAFLSILIVCVILFIAQQIGTYTTMMLSFPPWLFRDFSELPTLLKITSSFAPLTSMFLHANFFHIFFNMLFLFFVGMPLEQRIGNRNFMIIYLLSGLIGGFFQYSIGTYGIGASGAVLGILGAFAYLYPHERFTVFLLFIPLRNIPIVFIAAFYLIVDVMLQISGGAPSIGHLAHIGGMVGGFAVAALIKRRGGIGTYKTSRTYGTSRVYGTSRTYRPTRIGTRMKRLNVYELYNISRDKERVEAALKEDIKEVQRAIIESIIQDGKCPRCGEKLKIKGNRVECDRCNYCFNLFVNK